jgi:hypothetical protein
MSVPAALLRLLRIQGPTAARDLVALLHISRPTLMRAVQTLGEQVVVRGKARRTAYAARRSIRGSQHSIPIYRIDRAGNGERIGTLDPVFPNGCALTLQADFDWPLDDSMRDGWFGSLPYPLDDMRPQGFLGRHFARAHAALLQVPDDPTAWGEDDILHALSILGSDTPGSFILGTSAYQRHLDEAGQAADFIADDDALAERYVQLAHEALTHGVGNSSAAGEFPKFAARRKIHGVPTHVLVKFSGADNIPGTRRWADLLVCEHLALRTVAEQLRVPATDSRIVQAGNRTFLEVVRFDRHGARGRSEVCTWAALNAALFGLPGSAWTGGADALQKRGWLPPQDAQAIHTIWHFGRLIANDDMHDGNLAFRPGLRLAPVYDMLPMLYAPVRGVELPQRQYRPRLPLPEEAAAWRSAAEAARAFWECAANDKRISRAFRTTCGENAKLLRACL